MQLVAYLSAGLSLGLSLSFWICSIITSLWYYNDANDCSTRSRGSWFCAELECDYISYFWHNTWKTGLADRYQLEDAPMSIVVYLKWQSDLKFKNSGMCPVSVLSGLSAAHLACKILNKQITLIPTVPVICSVFSERGRQGLGSDGADCRSPTG